jgi:hypothetical protein
LQEAPAFAVVAFAGVEAVAFEIDIVDESILAVRGGGDFLVVGSDAIAVACGSSCEDFWQGGA